MSSTSVVRYLSIDGSVRDAVDIRGRITVDGGDRYVKNISVRQAFDISGRISYDGSVCHLDNIRVTIFIDGSVRDIVDNSGRITVDGSDR